MRYGSVCSGIEAATAAWHHMGWEPAFFSEIEAFPRAVLEHHYPEVPLHGDFTTIEQNQYGKIDLLVGGTPCQSFSVAGLRGGLDDDRGNLALEFCRLAQREQPRWIVWENVPGVLSSGGGRDFGSILGALEDLGYGLAYRVLDAQYFGVAQRRRRVFVVGYLGDWRPAAAVLFERHGMSGHPAPSREARKEAARAALSGAEERGGCGRDGPDLGERHIFQDSEFGVGEYDTAGSLRAGRIPEHQMVLDSVGALSCSTGPKGHDAGNNQGGDYIVTPFNTDTFIAFNANAQADQLPTENGRDTRVTDSLTCSQNAAVAYPIDTMNHIRRGDGHSLGDFVEGAPSFTLTKGHSHAVATQSAVRRLTPVECERLQGFPDNFTAIPWKKKKKKGPEQCPDGPRYKALGNSMAVPVMRWIGERIQLVDDFISLF